MQAELQSIARTALENPGDSITSLYVAGWASPDGKEAYNIRLSRNRAISAGFYLCQLLGYPMTETLLEGRGENWPLLRQLVAEDKNVPCQPEVLDIIDSDADNDEKELLLRNLRCDAENGHGPAWNYLIENIFPSLRSIEINIEYSNGDVISGLLSETSSSIERSAVAEQECDSVATPVYTLPTQPEPSPAQGSPLHAYVKTNIPAWAMLWTNVAGEVDFARHWSAAVSLYYSGFNYFHSDRKFRTLAVMPEVRYWLRDDNQGFFISPHFGLAWYNCAFGGELRYQDHNGNTPAIGGGASLGFRFNISRNRRWKLEASIGYGIYRLDYDTFLNSHNGALTGRRQRTFYGIDNAAISLCYTFSLPRKTTSNTLSQ